MQTYRDSEIRELPLSVPYFRRKAACFLEANGLRLESLDVYYTFQDADGNILAGAGLQGDVIKCLAVSEEARSQGLALPLLSQIVSSAAARGITKLKVFTKPEHRVLFEGLGFRLLASAPQAILLENGGGLEQYGRYLAKFRHSGRTGVVVMHANPFTLGHRYLLERAAAAVDRLIVIPVREELSLFSYEERKQMLLLGAPDATTVVEGSAYQISALTFPTYFLKELSAAAETQMRLDLDLFARHIAPALGATVRFVGSEPRDWLSARYNALMREILPGQGVEVVTIDRLADAAGVVSATCVRSALSSGRFREALLRTPPCTHPFLLAQQAGEALKTELNTPLKPGLVGPDGNGAHADMNYGMMLRSIDILRPYFVRMAQTADPEALRTLGLEAEGAMLAASGGVNTYKGAIFALGLALSACGAQGADTEEKVMRAIHETAGKLFAGRPAVRNAPSTHGERVVAAYGVKGAREMALDGYRDLFRSWQPFYRSVKAEAYAVQKTLLHILSGLDDTCILHRAGYGRAQTVKREAGDLCTRFSEKALSELCADFAAGGISPGGAADMLALTVFLDRILETT